jgi:2-keto-4-pentenoate hydratase/2-oxohepta-3-ene-1,7-dioic acid hydratase in catechol pathway
MNNYRHQFKDVIICPDNLGKIVCVGRNYKEHAKELNNPIPKEPVLFIKPATAAVAMDRPIVLPVGLGECHHELEIALLIGQPLTQANHTEALAAVVGVGLGLDLTLRDIQTQLKSQGMPWERAKAFDGSCPLSAFKSTTGIDLQQLELTLYLNDHIQQQGNSDQMLFSVARLLAEISWHFTLLPGDVILTGTPAGVGPLQRGDHLRMVLGNLLELNTTVK